MCGSEWSHRFSHKSLTFESKSKSLLLNQVTLCKTFPLVYPKPCFWKQHRCYSMRLFYWLHRKELPTLAMHYTLLLYRTERGWNLSWLDQLQSLSPIFFYAKVLLFVPVHLAPASLFRAAAGTAPLLWWIFPVITQAEGQNGTLTLEGYGVLHLQSKRTPFVSLCGICACVCVCVNICMS